MLGFILLTVVLYAGSAYGQCDPDGVLACTQDYLANVRNALGDGSGRGVDLDGVCRHTKNFLDCAKGNMRGCGPDVQRKMDQQLGDAERKLGQYGCNPDGTYSGSAQGGGLGSMEGCDQASLLGCLQTFMTDIRSGGKDEEEICADVSQAMTCMRNGMQGCPQEVKDKFEQHQNIKKFSDKCAGCVIKNSVMMLIAAIFLSFFISK